MPFILDYTDPISNVTYVGSYWAMEPININLNLLQKSITLTFKGYASVDDFEAGFGEIAFKVFTFSDPDLFNTYIVQGAYVTSTPYFVLLETMVNAESDFFTTATQVSFIRPSSIEIGSQGSDTVVVTFPATVLTDLNHLGVVIKVNGSTATLLAKTPADDTPSLTFTYTLDTPVDANDVVTWENDSTHLLEGNGSGLILQTFPAQSVENTVGEYLAFNDVNDVIWNVAI